MRTKYFLLSIVLLLFLNPMYGQDDGRDREGDCIFSSNNPFIADIASKIDSNGWIEFKPLGLFQKGDLFTMYKSEMGLSDDDEMVLISSEEGENGDEHNRYKQLYKGTPVECGNLIEHFRKCLLVQLNGKFLCDISMSVIPLLNENAAVDIALNDFVSTSYMWNDTIAEREIKEDSGDPNATYYPNPKLVIDCSKTLVYHFKINTLDSILEYRIDANTGTILSKINPVLNCGHVEKGENIDSSFKESKAIVPTDDKIQTIMTDMTTFGHTLFSGIQSIRTNWSGCWLCSSKHRLIANNYSSKIETRDNELSPNTNAWKRKVTMSGLNNTTWPVSEVRHTQTHWAVQKSYDYFSEVHGNSIGAGNGTIRAKSNCGINFAAYLGDTRSLVFGFRGGTYLGVLDAAGHEFTHLVVHEKSDLGQGQVGNTESRSLNESFADIFGTLIEREYRPGGWDWIFEDETAVPLRDVQNPNLSPTGAQPTIYEGANWNFNPSAGPHGNGGVQNKWFSLLALGGFHNGINVQAIGIDKAAEITWKNLWYYIKKDSEYIDARNGAVQSAIDLFGECSFEHAQTQLAWQAVGLGQANNCFSQYGLPVICQDKKNLPISVSISNSFNQNLTWTPIQLDIEWPPFISIHTNTTNWDYVTSGINNEVLTITNIPDNLPLGQYNFFMYEDEIGNVGWVNFHIWNCPGIQGPVPNPTEIFDFCKSKDKIPTAKFGKVKMDLKITPNPVQNELMIEGVSHGEKYIIFDITGKEYTNGTIHSNGIISVINIPTGIYFIKVSNNAFQNSKHGKFIKTN